MKYEVKPNGLKFRGWENLEKRDPKFGCELQQVACCSFTFKNQGHKGLPHIHVNILPKLLHS